MKGIRNNNFTFIRLAAASLVIVFHSFKVRGIKLDPISQLIGFERLGSIAVATFFVVSGYLIASSLQRSPSMFIYLKKRILRIYPAYITVLIVTVFILGPCVSSLGFYKYFLNINLFDLFKHVYLYNWDIRLPGVFGNLPQKYFINNALWTLPVEFTAYLIIMIIFPLKKIKPEILIIVIVLLGIGYFIMDLMDSKPVHLLNMNVMWVSKFFIFFFMGALLKVGRNFIKFSKGNFIIVGTVFFASCFIERGSFLVLHQAIYFLTWPYIVICFAYLPIPYIGKLDRFGDISYGTYLYAYPVQQIIVGVEGANIGSLRMILYSLAISLSLGALSWVMIEKPALRLKNIDLYLSFYTFLQGKKASKIASASDVHEL